MSMDFHSIKEMKEHFQCPTDYDFYNYNPKQVVACKSTSSLFTNIH